MPAQILAGSKTLTARCWKRKPPAVGSLFRAQRGRKKSTAFAVCVVKRVWRWDGQKDGNAMEVVQKFRNEIACLEGFAHWGEFYETYKTLNADRFDDPNRNHFFIQFEIQKIIGG